MIYALVIAIDKYPIRHHQLNGCINDAEAFIAYLEGNYACEELNIKRLMDEDATRNRIIEGFQHFRQANADDTCVLYYCGHGAQATAPPEFRHIDPDGLLETLVCWDSRIEGGRDLFDKELSYLIWEATKDNNPHFTAIFDCCHSGTNTRDTRVRARMAEAAKDIPQARDFHGLASYSRSEHAGRTQYAPPSGRHIALAGARAEQTAKELRIGQKTHGAFTYNLIAILEQFQGNITYRQLIAHLQGRVPNYVQDQTPQLGTIESKDGDLLFLGKRADAAAKDYTIHYDAKAKEWRINVGEIHNLSNSQADQIIVGLKVGTQSYELGVAKVDIRHAVLKIVPDTLDKSSSYPAELKSFPARLLRVGLDPEIDKALAEQIIQAAKDVRATYFKIVAQKEEPEYWIKPLDGNLILTRPGDDHPVFRRLPADDADMLRLFLLDVNTVGHYHHVLDIHNPRTTIKDSEYEIEFFRIADNASWEADDLAPAEKVNWQEEVIFNYDYDPTKEGAARWLMPAFRCKVRNTGTRTLYFSVLS
ncbi:MAG: caspase family protein, partial [Bacteroidetes bacterium]